MRLKFLKNYLLLPIIFLGIVFVLFTFSFIIFSPQVKSSYLGPASLTTNKTPTERNQEILEHNTSALPVRIKISTIKLDAKLESVGLTAQGAAGVPFKPANAAWLNTGPRPGDVGAAVITGHFGFWKNGDKGVFNNLNKIKVGAKIQVENKNGTIYSFVVRKISKYSPDAEAPEIFSSDDDKSHLNLITCEGVWDKISKSYSQRLVIFADKE